MAVDGIEHALRRFLSRCPELKSRTSFDSLSKQGAGLSEEEVVDALADVFLHPSYTIPLVGCFRPLARRILEKEVSLLRLVLNLRSNSSGSVKGNEELLKGFENFGGNVIDHYDRSGMGLNLHELACLAFCRASELAPFLLRSMLEYFKFAPPPFQRILNGGMNLLVQGEGQLVHVVRTSYRILVVSPEAFSRQWNWSCFLDLAELSRNSLDTAELGNDVVDIRWCMLQILSIILKSSDTTAMKFGIGAEDAFKCLLRWEQFIGDVSLEMAGLYIEKPEQIKLDGIVGSNGDNLLNSLVVNSMTMSPSIDKKPQSWSPRRAFRDDLIVNAPFVLTPAMKRSFEMVLLAVSQKWPVLLYGPPGVGKSALIRKLAKDSGNYVVYIHMDDQIDGKTLVGSYVCTEQPGEFRWQPGSLTQAALSGLWVVFEDIDKAPLDVYSILLPLLEGARSFVTGHGEVIHVSESFRLFSTISSSRLNTSSGSNCPGTLWRKVMVKQPSREELKDIVKVQYPSLECLVEKLIETFEKVNGAVDHRLSGYYSSSVGRFSLRDILKWCRRIQGLGFSFRDMLSDYEVQCIYNEAVDIFAASLPSGENGVAIRKDIARIWGVSSSVAETTYPTSKPEIQDMLSGLRIGRVILQHARALHGEKKPFVEIKQSLHAIERIACSVEYNEPVLLVGETGTGKTTLVQHLASRLGQKLTVLNLSQQSDVADLLGGFKPISPQYVCIPLYKEFEGLFSKTFSVKANHEFLDGLQKHLCNKNWEALLQGIQSAVTFWKSKKDEGSKSEPGKKRKKPLDEEIVKAWDNLSMKLEIACRQIRVSSGMVFSFVEGAFVNALRSGEWILLDEVNLAPPETLQRIGGVLEGESGSLCLAEKGDISFVKRHPNFRIFACMNPATDAGKRDLPYSIRSRFTEYFIDDVLEDNDLSLFVNQFVDEDQSTELLVRQIVSFYKSAKRDSEERLQDGANQKPQYSLRSLFRALEYTRKARRKFKLEKALYDGFCMFFLTLLDRPGAKLMNQMILSHLLGSKMPPQQPFDAYITVKRDSSGDEFVENYVQTKTVKEQLRNLARAIFIQKYPVLLQGPTSSGKTSLVRFLAAVTGREFVRINNHEHTDLQEYLGSYITDSSGKLVFHEGVLVRAVRSGSWIVLDELNLAPSDVLEALNRLLDDNRELFVPELQETIRAHPNFMLFATQNPPTVYAGRKMLSRAFRNRFVEIHVDEIPEEELSTILENRCKISPTHAKKMVDVMKDLQLQRQNSNVFAGKHGYITPRDLFRWANRVRVSGDSSNESLQGKHRYEVLASEGYYLLAERLRDEGEKAVVKEILERHFHLTLSEDDLYKQELSNGEAAADVRNNMESFAKVIWTRSMWRMYSLVRRCYEMREPVLLVGETGGGKTTVCQWLSYVLKLKLHILNCHQYTETSDFIGGFYPVRERSKLIAEFNELVGQLTGSKTFMNYHTTLTILPDIGRASSTLEQLSRIISDYRRGVISASEVTSLDVDIFEQKKMDLEQLHEKWQTIFMWQDGPLVQAMRAGDLFLVDEISLADDSVLERLNSVLEPERTLSLPEKGGSVMEKITAHGDFFVLATMNPGGDYGKKELSPALRNRFTEIWVPSVTDASDLKSIASNKISKPGLTCIVDPMINFWEWFNKLEFGRSLTIRDLISWISFVNEMEGSLGGKYAFLHGVFLILLDGLNLGTGMSRSDGEGLREKSLHFLLEQLKVDENSVEYSKLSKMESYGWGGTNRVEDIPGDDTMQCDNIFGIDPFYIERGHLNCEAGGFELLAPTTRKNTLRVLRAMQLKKPALLEGSPGVGKTSLVTALGRFSGHKVVRINLSEQTDMMDLLGSDLPVESDEGIKFSWSDGILLQALKEGSWVLLDELNLAPQSVLEGLNAILDHRAEVYIPELNQTFTCPPSFRVFACQNPSSQGGGRKGLPKSFLNRFTKVYVDELTKDDYLSICMSLYPSVPRPFLSKLILFNKRLFEETMVDLKFGQDGSPWEFNLRDVIRSCEMIKDASDKSAVDCFLNLLYVQRMRTAADRKEVLRLFEHIFEVKPFINPFPRVQLNSVNVVVGNTAIKRNNVHLSKASKTKLKILPSIRLNLEAAATCVKHQWLCILVGPSSSGKTSSIRTLAELTGNVLHELNLSAATDISELLGCFEQYSIFRNLRAVAAQIEQYVNEYSRLQLECSMSVASRVSRDLLSKWYDYSSALDVGGASNSATIVHEENWRGIGRSFCLLDEILKQLKQEMGGGVLPVSWSDEELDRVRTTISKLQEVHSRVAFSAKFEWVTGSLVKAIENGDWIVLEDANLCNPTVLDRINSVVETSGSITVNECGTVDGKPVVLHPHPNFRMFLTVNPSYGEVSRAMRNRGVEIYMMDPFWLLDEESGQNVVEKMELKDVKRFLIQSGIPNSDLVDSMAKAHIYARDEGLLLNIRITYFELARWVHLFQQLLTSGNLLSWSLQISWEHTYLSSFGESDGEAIVAHAINAYLYVGTSTLFNSIGHPLCLPGGWPLPLDLDYFVHYPKEASVKQNCMYLEYLGARQASARVARTQSNPNCTVNGACASAYLMDMEMLKPKLFPQDINGMITHRGNETDVDFALADTMLFFAAEWTIEQATTSDLDLYLFWLSWFSSQILPFCQILSDFLNTFKKEQTHPIWKYIMHCAENLSPPSQVEIGLQIPVLSSVMVDLVASRGIGDLSATSLQNAINCIGVVRRCHQQWDTEKRHNYADNQNFRLLLKSLRVLEKHILETLIDSPSFELLARLCGELLEDHVQFWVSVISSKFDMTLFFWRSLKKDVKKLQQYYPEASATLAVLDESRKLVGISSSQLQSERSLLWVYGGHPILPASADVYHAQLRFFNLCDTIWPEKISINQHDSTFPKELVASFSPELRLLSMQGICIASHLSGKYVEDTAPIIKQLDHMNQALLQRFQYETLKLENNARSNDAAISEAKSECCIQSPQMIFTKSGCASWLDVLRVNDSASLFLDMNILQELSSILLHDVEEIQQASRNVYHLLERSLEFSLSSALRPPQMFSSHQKIMWTLDAWGSVDAAHMKILAFVLEIWFRWHSSLWNLNVISFREPLKLHGHDFSVPDIIMRPFRIAMAFQNQGLASPIKDYAAFCVKLKVVSHNIWQNTRETDVPRFLLTTARLVLQEIIYAHRKSFDADEFAAIKSLFCSLNENGIMQDKVQSLCSYLLSSRHQGLKDVVQPFIEPVLRQLYVNCPSIRQLDSDCSLGFVWLYIGSMRYCLLLGTDDLDPAVKYSCKQSQLAQKKTLLELEIQVRKECDYLAGSLSQNGRDSKRLKALEHLTSEQSRVGKKVVFRSNPMKFKKLRGELKDYHDRVTSLLIMLNEVNGANSPSIIQQVSDWQKTSSLFIDRLSEEYPECIDVIQPVQVAIYEMKLGSSMILSSIFEEKFFKAFDNENRDRVMGTLHSVMRFPRAGPSQLVDLTFSSRQEDGYSCNIEFPSKFPSSDVTLLEKLASVRCVAPGEMVSGLQIKASVHHSILVQVAHSVARSQVMSSPSFKMLDQVFWAFATLWREMKFQSKEKEEFASQQYKFRTRGFKIEKILEVDISTIGGSINDETFLEWQQLATEEEHNEEIKEDGENENLEDIWNLMQEPILNDMVQIHIQLFGSSNLVVPPGTFHTSDADILQSFTESYSLVAGIIKDLGSLRTGVLDTKLMPEHLLRLILDQEQMTVSSHLLARRYNFYKDANAPILEKMVKFLNTLEQKVLSLLSEWEDHPGLQKVLDVIRMLLAIPLSTPLAKAVSGLQFLVNRAHILKEDSSRLSLSKELEPLVGLISSWQKMEFESWPQLLDEVQDQYEKNAAKLWFPLYSVLHRHSDDISLYSQSTIQSLQEFMQSSNVGEFRKRLQLILAFHGQVISRLKLGIDPSSSHKQNLRILYNIFGAYAQFLPIATECMETNRRNTEKEVRELLKLCKWDRAESLVSMDNSKRMRQKLKKHIQKYSDALQQPLKVLLNQRAAQNGIDMQFLHGHEFFFVFPDENVEMPNAALDTKESTFGRFLWSADWMKKVRNVSENLCRTPETVMPLSSFLSFGSPKSTLHESEASQTVDVNQEEWKDLWFSIENISRRICDYSELWKNDSKSIGKRRSLADLLKLLESSGLARHMWTPTEDKHESNWLLQSSHDARHLLLIDGGVSSQPHGLTSGVDVEWKTVNNYYFKSIVAMRLLQQVCLNPHKDFTLEQVTRSGSFVYHLVSIQQEQRDTAYNFAHHLKILQTYVSTLGDLYVNSSSKCSISQNQHAALLCLWQQKQLFDELRTVLCEGSLLLRKVESIHHNTCDTVRAAAHGILNFIESLIPFIQRSKEELDKCLLAQDDGSINVLDLYENVPVIPNKMDEIALNNFDVLKDFEEKLIVFRNQSVNDSIVRHSLLSSLDDILKKGKVVLEQYKSTSSGTKKCSILPHGQDGAFKVAFENINQVLLKVVALSRNHVLTDESTENLTSWKSLFNSYASELSLEPLCSDVLKAVCFAEKLLNSSGSEDEALSFHAGSNLRTLQSLLDLILIFGNGVLGELLALHKNMSAMTHNLAKTLALLFSKGYGISKEEEVDDNNQDMSQNASGTGMGEGVGTKDVSDQIEDEDQLLGDSKQSNEEQDAPSEVPNKDEKGIEMEQDFEGEMCSVSQDSEEDDDEKEDEDNGDGQQIESAMGKTGDESEVVDEKLWDKEEEQNPENNNEKYESGASVRDKDESSREMRGKEDGKVDESDDLQNNEGEDDDGSNDNSGGLQDTMGDDVEDMEDMNMDKEDAYMDSTGVDPDQSPEEDVAMDEVEAADAMEEGGDEPDDPAIDEKTEAERADDGDESLQDAEVEHTTETSEKDNDVAGQDPDNPNIDLTRPQRDSFKPGTSSHSNDFVATSESGTQLKGESGSSDAVNGVQEMDLSNSGGAENDLTPMSGVPSGIEQDIKVAGLSDGGKLNEDHSNNQVPREETSALQKSQPNPYRSIGDALDGWKERAKVPIDLQDHTEAEGDDEILDDNADEYGYVTEKQKGTAQALGPANSEQVDQQIEEEDKRDESQTPVTPADDVVDMNLDTQKLESKPKVTSASVVSQKFEEALSVSNQEKLPEEEVMDHLEGHVPKYSESIVRLKKSSANDDILQLGKMSISSDELTQTLENRQLDISDEAKANAASVWRRYELRTTRLSQELAEQLRLVMEPTLASKLQGDYKTGKRINMKKVISYIASHYRKDKIWQRRTRPNKRDYQVVIAVDDSRSMSESGCGAVAIEALVTVCRALSQLEMGSLAVASFGKEGNMRLLHEFDRPFSAEAGTKMISNLTFKQESSLADEPVVDLLKNLNNLLNANVAKSRLPSGQNPLQQLVLIIGDGRFHEKKSLKRCVRDFQSSKRMAAFMLLDSPEESIMDLSEVSFQGGNMKSSKYMDSFPFPYYVVLRNIEALPRTLADLLRQWFELMQQVRD